MKYKVLVDDNFHRLDESERPVHGEFETLEAAVAACRKIVDDFLVANYKSGMTAQQLYQCYTSFGDDPFVVPADKKNPFSAWNYAKARCAEICREGR